MIKNYLKNQSKDIAQLLSLTLGKNHAWLLANDDYQLSETQACQLNALIKKREQGVPFAYLSGTKGFYHLDFKVTPDTLIPRPETELLIDIALDLFADKTKPCHLLDLGTGSGIIAITLADKNPHWHITATDFSKKALTVAKQNATIVTNEIDFQQGSWFEAVPNTHFDLIISNPPYIEQGSSYLKNLTYEPQSALTSGKDGLDAIRLIIENAPKYLNKQGYLLLEHGFNQQQEIAQLLEKDFFNIQTFNDYNYNQRAIFAQLKL
ncbi:Protein-N(5)-glutamine methyltransferase PrmC, methylates polypeptide chain release factors RF1 and RF2 [uncultured Candidatus Thioglobus sp.]|nr:Protein-N(5)-glutamine methyltransferase PrmC, methylates polypeptide chain release factors RF1 and RF2 [uncultured Candidatus Thioglobus sp.]